MEAHCTTGQVKRREWFTPMNARVALIIRGAVLASGGRTMRQLLGGSGSREGAAILTVLDVPTALWA
jgi:hypothetical protein